jgi:hypothetical protein
MAVVGIFSAFSVVTILTSDSIDKLTGTYLAQEGMEVVRNIRDTNWLNMDNGSGTSWDDNGLQCNILSGCEMKADYASIQLSGYTDDYLYLDSNGFYSYNTSNATETKIKRKIIVTPITDVDGDAENIHIIKVTVEVSWDKKATLLNPALHAGQCDIDNGIPSANCIVAEDTLYNWYNYKYQ